ncbi:Shikimate kinase 1, chloroplastic [Glycine max]|nr:Shikimate kinase 1, chloroplastic [Glycine max]
MLQARGATSYIYGIRKDNFGEEIKKKCTHDGVKLPLLAWYPCKFCCSRFQGEGVTLKFPSCLNMLLSIWEQLTFNFSFKESKSFLPATRSHGDAFQAFATLLDQILFWIKVLQMLSLMHKHVISIDGGTDSRPLLHSEARNAYMETIKCLSIICEERSEAYANVNVKVSLENMAAKLSQRDVSDFSPTAIAMEY